MKEVWGNINCEKLGGHHFEFYVDDAVTDVEIQKMIQNMYENKIMWYVRHVDDAKHENRF